MVTVKAAELGKAGAVEPVTLWGLPMTTAVPVGALLEQPVPL